MRLRAMLSVVLLCSGCQWGEREVDLGRLRVRLTSPSGVDPLADADALNTAVYDRDGELLFETTGRDPEAFEDTVPSFGIVRVVVTATRREKVLSAARTGLLPIREDGLTIADALFLPINEPFETQDEPLQARMFHQTTVGPDGRVLLIGGRDVESNSALDTTEWWDVREGFGEPGPDLPNSLWGAEVAPYADHELLIVGGSITESTSSRAQDTYLMNANRVEVRQELDMDERRIGHCVASATPSRVVTAGGTTDDTTALEVFDDQSDFGTGWTSFEALNFASHLVEGCAGDGLGRVLFVGRREGTQSGWGVLNVQDRSAIATSFTPVTDTNELRGPLVVPLPTGDIWVAGGVDALGNTLSKTYTVDLATAEAIPDDPLDTLRARAHWRPWIDPRYVAVAGGYRIYTSETDSFDDPVETVEVIRMSTGDSLSIDTPDLQDARIEVLPDGVLFVTSVSNDGPFPTFESRVIVPWVD